MVLLLVFPRLQQVIYYSLRQDVHTSATDMLQIKIKFRLNFFNLG